MTKKPDFDAILNADVGLDKEQDAPQRSPEDRLTMLSNAAEASLSPMQSMLRGTEVRGTIIGGSRFEESYALDTIPFVMRTRIRGKILNVLGETGKNYATTQITGADSTSTIERTVWTQKLGATLDAIEKQKSTSKASLSILNGLTDVLEKSTESIRQQWIEQAAEAREFLDRRGTFFKIIGLRRKARFEKYSDKFLRNLEDKKAQIKASLEMVKTQKETDIAESKNKLQAKLAAHSSGDPAERRRLWEFVKEVVKNPTTRNLTVDGILVSPRSFGIKDHGDFLEAVVALGYTSKADQLEKTEALSKDTNDTIKTLGKQEEAFEKTLNEKTNTPEKDAPADVTAEIASYVTPAKEKIEDTSQLVTELEKAIRAKAPDFAKKVYKNKLHSPEQKLWNIICYLNTAGKGFETKDLNKEALQNLLRYMKDTDKKTKLKGGSSEFDDRFRAHLMEKYQEEQEKQLQENLEKNTTTQWEILQMAPEGEFVELNYFDTMGVSTLPSAKEMMTKQNKGRKLQIIKKTANGVVLEHPTHKKTFVISGPSTRTADGWLPNVAVYNAKGTKIKSGSGVAGIVLGINLNK